MSPSIARFVLAALLTSTTALAQTGVNVEGNVEGTVVRPAARSVVDFTEVKVTGIPDKPAGAIYIVPKKPKVRNLIELRGNFRPELATSSSRL